MSLTEQWKYERAYQLESYHLQGERLKYATADVAMFVPGATYLDVGCGRAELLALATTQGLMNCKGIETVPALCGDIYTDSKDFISVIHGDICELPFIDKSFDYVTCYDVLEHLPPGEEQDALAELARVCSGECIISTNDRPSHLPDGTDLHVNKRPRGAWHADIVRIFTKAGASVIDASEKGRHRDWHWHIRFAPVLP